MESNSYLQQILHSLNCFLPMERAQVNPGNVMFAREEDVEFQATARRVPQSCLISADQFPGPLAGLFAAGPSWINASAIPLVNGRFLITIATGRGIGNPSPSINVSHELDKMATITN